jgi:hypothetical protein
MHPGVFVYEATCKEDGSVVVDKNAEGGPKMQQQLRITVAQLLHEWRRTAWFQITGAGLVTVPWVFMLLSITAGGISYNPVTGKH